MLPEALAQPMEVTGPVAIIAMNFRLHFSVSLQVLRTQLATNYLWVFQCRLLFLTL